MRVLIAEDDGVMRRMLEVALGRWGYDYASAKDGDEAWSLYRSGDYDMVVTDWMMPGLTGLDFCKRIREYNKDQYTYIILLTSLDAKEHLAQGIEQGADDFVEKPFEPTELRARLKAGARIVELERNLAASNVKMTRDLQKAAATLESLLPQKKDLFAGLQIEWYFRPSTFIGGDFFNVLKLDEDHIGFYMVDVSGHGVSAALLAATLSHLLRPMQEQGGILNQITDNGEEILLYPRDVAAKLNRRFPFDMEMGTFFTFFYGIINRPKRRLRWVRCGHPKPVLLHQCGLLALEHGNPPIGILDGHAFEDFEVELEPGDKLFICSDGLLESANPQGEPFGDALLHDAIRKRHGHPVSSIVAAIMHDFNAHLGPAIPEDDITLLALEITD